MKFKVFISSVQREFAGERERLARYIRSDALLGRFFSPFLFEESPASDRSAQTVFLDEVRDCDIYLGIFGRFFGNEVRPGVSATECEYDLATQLGKTRLIFVFDTDDREQNERRFIGKIERAVTRKGFRTFEELQLGVYASLVAFLESNGFVRVAPFDMAFDTGATPEDLDGRKVAEYLDCLRDAKKITIPDKADLMWILKKLEAVDPSGRVSNTAVLLFGKNPQRFFPPAEVKCLQYWGTRVERPIPSFKAYDGGLIEQIEAALAFVMGRIDHEIGEPDAIGRAVGKDELPRLAIREAIVNAVCHRDYESNAGVQVMLFRDRLEIINPGTLPKGWTVDMLLRTHESSPRNTCLAKALNWAGYVERSGNGTESIVDRCLESGLAAPVYRPDAATFHVILWRKGVSMVTGSCATSRGVSGGVSGVSGGARLPHTAERVIAALMPSEKSRKDVATVLNLTPRARSLRLAMDSLLEDGLVEYTIPQAPRSARQKYRLTQKGTALAMKLMENADS